MARTPVTHCPRGHAYDDANTRLYKGMKFCRACDKDRHADRRANDKQKLMNFGVYPPGDSVPRALFLEKSDAIDYANSKDLEVKAL